MSLFCGVGVLGPPKYKQQYPKNCYDNYGGDRKLRPFHHLTLSRPEYAISANALAVMSSIVPSQTIRRFSTGFILCLPIEIGLFSYRFLTSQIARAIEMNPKRMPIRFISRSQ
jgi:hypothetical protein